MDGNYYVDGAAQVLYGPRSDLGFGSPETILNPDNLPHSTSSGSYRLGNEYKFLVDAELIGASFYRGVGSTNTSRRLAIYSAAGVLLGETELTVESGGGGEWVYAALATPIAVAMNDGIVCCYDHVGPGFAWRDSAAMPNNPAHVSYIVGRYTDVLGTFPNNVQSNIDRLADIQYRPATGDPWPVAVPGFPEAPLNGKSYGRRNAGWDNVVSHTDDIVDGGNF